MVSTKLLVTVSCQFSYRNLILSGLYERLRRDHELIVITSKDMADFLKKNGNKQYAVKVIEPSRKGRLYRLVNNANFFFKEKNRVRLKSKLKNLKIEKPRYYWAMFIIGHSFLSKTILIILNFLPKRKFFSDSEYNILYSNFNSAVDQEMFYNSKTKFNKSFYFVHSWDSPTLHGHIPNYLTCYFVWNDLVKNHLIEYHQISKSKIAIVGCPSYDILINKDFLKVPLIDEEYILYTAATERLFPGEELLLRELIERIIKDFPDIKIVLRPHPNDNRERFSDLRNIDAVFFDSVDREFGALKTQERYFNLIHHSKLVINLASTVSLDSIILDKKVVNIAFSKDKKLNGIIKRYYEYPHYKYLVDSKMVALGNNLDQILDEVRKVLKTKKKDCRRHEDIKKLFPLNDTKLLAQDLLLRNLNELMLNSEPP